MSNTARKAERSSRWAEKDLIEGKNWAKRRATPNAKREGRRMVRDAKRRRAKAERRIARAECEE